MNTRDWAITGAIGLAIILIGYFIILSRALAQKPTTPKSTNLSYGDLQKNIIPLLGTLEVNGQLPVSVSQEELGKEDPFK